MDNDNLLNQIRLNQATEEIPLPELSGGIISESNPVQPPDTGKPVPTGQIDLSGYDESTPEFTPPDSTELGTNPLQSQIQDEVFGLPEYQSDLQTNPFIYQDPLIYDTENQNNRFFNEVQKFYQDYENYLKESGKPKFNFDPSAQIRQPAKSPFDSLEHPFNRWLREGVNKWWDGLFGGQGSLGSRKDFIDFGPFKIRNAGLFNNLAYGITLPFNVTMSLAQDVGRGWGAWATGLSKSWNPFSNEFQNAASEFLANTRNPNVTESPYFPLQQVAQNLLNTKNPIDAPYSFLYSEGEYDQENGLYNALAPLRVPIPGMSLEKAPALGFPGGTKEWAKMTVRTAEELKKAGQTSGAADFFRMFNPLSGAVGGFPGKNAGALDNYVADRVDEIIANPNTFFRGTALMAADIFLNPLDNPILDVVKNLPKKIKPPTVGTANVNIPSRIKKDIPFQGTPIPFSKAPDIAGELPPPKTIMPDMALMPLETPQSTALVEQMIPDKIDIDALFKELNSGIIKPEDVADEVLLREAAQYGQNKYGIGLPSYTPPEKVIEPLDTVMGKVDEFTSTLEMFRQIFTGKPVGEYSFTSPTVEVPLDVTLNSFDDVEQVLSITSAILPGQKLLSPPQTPSRIIKLSGEIPASQQVIELPGVTQTTDASVKTTGEQAYILDEGSAYMNAYLRGGEENVIQMATKEAERLGSSVEVEIEKALNYASLVPQFEQELNNLPLVEKDSILFRGTESQFLPDKVGDVISDPGFISASSRKSVATGYSLRRGYPNKGAIIVIKDPKTARKLSLQGNEDEYVFPPGTKFKVTKITEETASIPKEGMKGRVKVYEVTPLESETAELPPVVTRPETPEVIPEIPEVRPEEVIPPEPAKVLPELTLVSVPPNMDTRLIRYKLNQLEIPYASETEAYNRWRVYQETQNVDLARNTKFVSALPEAPVREIKNTMALSVHHERVIEEAKSLLESVDNNWYRTETGQQLVYNHGILDKALLRPKAEYAKVTESQVKSEIEASLTELYQRLDKFTKADLINLSTDLRIGQRPAKAKPKADWYQHVKAGLDRIRDRTLGYDEFQRKQIPTTLYFGTRRDDAIEFVPERLTVEPVRAERYGQSIVRDVEENISYSTPKLVKIELRPETVVGRDIEYLGNGDWKILNSGSITARSISPVDDVESIIGMLAAEYNAKAGSGLPVDDVLEQLAIQTEDEYWAAMQEVQDDILERVERWFEDFDLEVDRKTAEIQSNNAQTQEQITKDLDTLDEYPDVDPCLDDFPFPI